MLQRQIKKPGSGCVIDAIEVGESVSTFTDEDHKDIFTFTGDQTECNTHDLCGCPCDGCGMLENEMDDEEESSEENGDEDEIVEETPMIPKKKNVSMPSEDWDSDDDEDVDDEEMEANTTLTEEVPDTQEGTSSGGASQKVRLCRIATKEYCDFVRGHWHENATLCSQVNCFSGVCAMIPFFGDNPNQFYRLFTSLFVHAGLFHLILTIAFQGYFMRDLEFLIGSKRMTILYFCSGIGGNLAAAIFVPYNPAVGPSSAQCGILAAVVVDCYHHRVLIEDLSVALRQHLLVLIVVLIIGLIPWVDNWAHLFGSIFGLLTAIGT
uniref:Rhomboid domain-containing protein n=2 Tax=Caenorhabditis tropicalis TaxID=1561998 RepID=A0A1I7UID6_9PELO